MGSQKLKKQVRDAKKRMNGRSNRRRRGTRFMIAAVCTGCIGIFAAAQWMFYTRPGAAYGQEIYQNAGDETGQKRGQAVGESNEGDTKKYKGKKRKNAGLLIVANKDHALPEDYDPGLRYICNGRLQASAVMYDDLVAMLRAAKDAGYDYWIASGYRDRQYQQELIDEDVREFMLQGMSYESALEKTMEETLPAGHSEHETGLSLDILCSGNTDMDISQSYEPGNRWLVEHCARYGFILRYPKGKEDITGISYEPWHFRYVGSAAEEIMEKGITLEEYMGI